MKPKKPKKPKMSRPLKWAKWGMFVGLAVAAVRADYGVESTSLLSWTGFVGYFVGGAAIGAFVAGIIAVMRNRLIR